ncbi:MAG: radical SAM-associated putative lipoprotein [Prolixibacteraceae bacterium]|nr:radical SAM-associated putative lipoprotein [Prolixibacteraceae bacterium]
MKNRFLKSQNRIITLIMSLLGIGTACSFGGCEYGTMAEYGTPSATFVVKGKVSNEEGLSINGIRVMMRQDTALTGQNGQYEVETVDFPSNQEFQILFEDVDGGDNNEYQNLDTVVVFVNPEFEGGDDDWYSGETSKEFDVKLKAKK